MQYPEDYDAHIDINYVDCATVGEIIFQEAIDEYTVGTPYLKNSLAICKVDVYGKEGAIPHFHLSTPDHRFESCICIHSNNYFSHGGKYVGTLNASQRRQLNKWLKTNNDISQKTNWDTIRQLWEMFNRECRFPKNRKVSVQPDYSTMTQFKDV